MDRRTSPYAYGFDDPIRHTDPDGMFGEDFNEGDPVPKRALQTAVIGAGGLAGGVFAASLVAGGTVAAGGTATIIGAPVGLRLEQVLLLLVQQRLELYGLQTKYSVTIVKVLSLHQRIRYKVLLRRIIKLSLIQKLMATILL